MIYIYAAIALGGALLTFVHLVKAVDSALSVRRA
jgi:TRAP-type C4-dicarboxylate transport system permease small subunit